MLDIIVVLGNIEDIVMKTRLDRAIDEYDIPLRFAHGDESYERKNVMILVTGTASESEFMHKYLLDNKIPQESIIVECESKNTVQNIINTEKMIEKLHLIPSQIIFCTSTFHIVRTVAIVGIHFQKYATRVQYIHTRESVPREKKQHESFLLLNLFDNFVQTHCNTTKCGRS